VQQIHNKQKKVRVWPINSSLWLKIATSQVVPSLGLTGLAPKIVDAISGLLVFYRLERLHVAA